MKTTKKKTIKCLLCGEVAIMTRRWHKFCSSNCRKIWYNKLREWAIIRIEENKDDMEDFLKFIIQ